jgi:hypothetical protein
MTPRERKDLPFILAGGVVVLAIIAASIFLGRG